MAKEVDIVLESYRVANAEKEESNHLRLDAGKYAWPDAQDMYRSAESSGGREYALDIYDSTAIDASFRLAANIMSWLMPVGSKWFEFNAADYEDNIDDNIRMWLSKATGVTYGDQTSCVRCSLLSGLMLCLVLGLSQSRRTTTL